MDQPLNPLSRRRVTIVLFAIYFIFAVLLNGVGTVILQSIHTFGITKQSAALLEAFKDPPIAITSFLVASWLPRFGYRRALLVSLIAVGLASCAMPLVPSFMTTRILFLVAGVSFALVRIAGMSTIGLITDSPRQHMSLMASIDGFFMFGVVSGYWLFSAFIDESRPDSPSWLAVYWLLAISSLACAGLLWTTRFPDSPVDQRQSKPFFAFGSMLSLTLQPAAIAFFVTAFLYVLIEQGIATWLPTFNNEILHLSGPMSVQAASIFAASIGLGRVSAGVAARRIDWPWILNICIVAVAALILISLPLTKSANTFDIRRWSDAPIAAYLFPLIGFFLGPIYPIVNSVILSALPRNRHAEMSGLITVFSALGGVTGSLITGMIFAYYGGQRAFYLALIPVCGILVSINLLRRQTRMSRIQRLENAGE